jgi:hypothetical protein
MLVMCGRRSLYTFDRLDFLIYVQPQGIGYESSPITANASSRPHGLHRVSRRSRAISLAASASICWPVFEFYTCCVGSSFEIPGRVPVCDTGKLFSVA